MRLAMYVDQVFWQEHGVFSTDEAFILFPASFIEAVDELTFIGRGAPEAGRAPYVIADPSIRVHGLPYYPRLWDVGAVAKSAPHTYRKIRETVRYNADRWDAVVIDGPHPIGQLLARECLSHRVPVALMVRQNLIEQMRAYPGRLGQAAVAAAKLLEWDFRQLARGRPVFTVGMEMANEYARFSSSVHHHFPCLVGADQFRMLSTKSCHADPSRLICVGRLAPERGHRFLFEAMDLLRTRGVNCHLDVVGSGELSDELPRRAAAIGLEEQVTFHGYVPYGPALFELYQQAGTFVLPSLTEGFPQVINESLSIGLPTIASAVGGVPEFLTHEETAMLVPPTDVGALATAIERVILEPALRDRLVANGRALMHRNTLEVNRSRILGVLRDELCS